MAIVVCQGLQSCLEPMKIESVVTTQNLSSKPVLMIQKPKLDANTKNSESVNKAIGWSFLSILEKPSSNVVKNEEVYIHPMAKRSASTLSNMSLEMCTESLGTETGSDVSESSDEFNSAEIERFGSFVRTKSQNFDRKMLSHRRVNGGFPPPLTSISGSDGIVKVSPHREGGRLVIKAVSVSDCGIKFEAERTNGKLTLSLLKDFSGNNKSGRVKMENEGFKEQCCDGDVEDGGSRVINGNKRKVGTKTGIRLPKRMSRLTSSFKEMNKFGSNKCKYGENKNEVMIRNWSLFRVVIS
ncbi:protein FANTASTIC FOUR 2-like [Rutidosis leptorrhynchoides]|uniref:protein FANTASTIC FOUR 2-like n=1 Tax=Rutidosis leptorrhynchoides TaxID=125765 RepID=UPI003A9A3C01